MPKIVILIESEERRGLGKENDPIRLVTQWHTPDGDLVAEEPDRYKKPGESLES